MKYFFIFIFLLSAKIGFSQQDSIIPQAGQAQNKTNSRLPEKGNIGISFNFVGFIDTLSVGAFNDFFGNEFIMGRYYLSDVKSLRFGLGINLKNEKKSTVDSVGSAQVKRDSIYKRTDFFISPGFERHFTGSKNLDPYVASVLTIGKIGRTKIKDLTTTTDTTGVSTSDLTFDQEGGYQLGLNLVAGCNYFFSEKLAIGAEYGFGIQSSRYGGDWSEVSIITPSSGSPTVNREVGSETINSTRLKMNSNIGIMLSYFF